MSQVTTHETSQNTGNSTVTLFPGCWLRPLIPALDCLSVRDGEWGQAHDRLLTRWTAATQRNHHGYLRTRKMIFAQAAPVNPHNTHRKAGFFLRIGPMRTRARLRQRRPRSVPLPRLHARITVGSVVGWKRRESSAAACRRAVPSRGTARRDSFHPGSLGGSARHGFRSRGIRPLDPMPAAGHTEGEDRRRGNLREGIPMGDCVKPVLRRKKVHP